MSSIQYVNELNKMVDTVKGLKRTTAILKKSDFNKVIKSVLVNVKRVHNIPIYLSYKGIKFWKGV